MLLRRPTAQSVLGPKIDDYTALRFTEVILSAILFDPKAPDKQSGPCNLIFLLFGLLILPPMLGPPVPVLYVVIEYRTISYLSIVLA